MLSSLTNKMISLFQDHRPFVWQFFILQGSQVLIAVINVIIFAYMGRVLDLSGFGIVSLGYAIVSGLMVFVDLGLPIIGTREIAKSELSAGSQLITISVVRLILSVAVIAISAVVVVVIFKNKLESVVIILSCVWLIPYALSSEWFFQGLSKMYYVATSRIIYQLSTLIIVVVFVSNSSSLVGAALARPLAQFIVATFLIAVALRFVKSSNIKVTFANWRLYLCNSIPLGFAIFLAQVYSQRIDHVFLRIWYSSDAVALYSSAYTLHMAIVGVIQTVIFVFLPALSKSYIKGRGEFDRTRKQFLFEVLFFSIPLTFVTLIFADVLLIWTFGDNYLGAERSLKILAFDPIVIGVSSIFAYSLIVAGFEKDIILSYGSGAIINVLLNVLLIPRLGIDGAAISTIFAELLVLCVGFFCFQRRMGLLARG